MNLEALIQETARKVLANLQENPKPQVAPATVGGSLGVNDVTGVTNLAGAASPTSLVGFTSTTDTASTTGATSATCTTSLTGITSVPGVASLTCISGNSHSNSDLYIILDGIGDGFHHSLSQMQAVLNTGLKGHAILTKMAASEKHDFQGAQLISPEALVPSSRNRTIFIPYLSLGLAGKIAQLVEDEAALRVIVRGLLDQCKVFVGVSELDLLLGGKKRLAFGLSQKIKEYQRVLKSYDIVMIKDLTQVIKACNLLDAVAEIESPAAVSRLPKTPATCAACSSGCEGCGKCVVLNQAGVSNLIESGAARVSAGPDLSNTQVHEELAGMIDHTLLKPNCTENDIQKICAEARQYKFASVCVNPGYVALAAELLKGSNVKVCTVVGFPLGATTTATKAQETREAVANGAAEIDMVINVGALKSANNTLVRKDIEAVVEAAAGRAIVKVILETSLLTEEEKVRACLLSKYAGANFVKTATGFGPGGATIEDIALMRKIVGSEMGVKASGGIGDLQTAQAMIAAGANRIGASASVAIVKGAEGSKGGY